MKTLHRWSISHSYKKGRTVWHIDCHSVDHLCEILQNESFTSSILEKLEFENFTDEVHAFMRRYGHRVRYAYLQYEGPTEEVLKMELADARDRGDLDRVQEIEFELEELNE
jgi:hypothetical protein